MKYLLHSAKAYMICILVVGVGPILSAQNWDKGPNGKYGYLDFDGEQFLPYEYDEFFTPKLDTSTLVKKNGKLGVINKKGKVLVNFEYTHLVNFLPNFGPLKGLYAVSKSVDNTNWGFINTRGKVILPLKYEYIRQITPDLLVGRMAMDSTLQFFNGQGKPLYNKFGRRIDDLYSNYYSVLAVDRTRSSYTFDGKAYTKAEQFKKYPYIIDFDTLGFGILRQDGKLLVNHFCISIKDGASNQWILEKRDDYRAVIDSSGKMIIPFRKQYMDAINNVYHVTSIEGDKQLFGIIDATGQTILPFASQSPGNLYIQQNLRFVKNSHPELYFQIIKYPERHYGLYTKAGVEVLPIRFGQIAYTSEDHALIVWMDEKKLNYEAFNFKGEKVLNRAYENLKFTHDPNLLYGAIADSLGILKWGFIKLSDRGVSADFGLNRIYDLENGFIISENGLSRKQLYNPFGRLLNQNEYFWISEPDLYQLKHFKRMKSFKGKLIATAGRSGVDRNLVIGINESGEEFLLDVEAEKAALQVLIDQAKPKPEPRIVVQENEVKLMEAMTPIEDQAIPVEEVSEVKDPGENAIFQMIDTPPSFPKGTAMEDWLAKHIKYPAIALENGIQGMVIVKFVVEKDGSKTDIKIVRGIWIDCDKEAIRLVTNMPNFIPGKHQGIVRRAYYTLPVKFKIN